MQPILFFDIETATNPDAIGFLPEPAAPANYKDADKIAQYVTEKKAEQIQQAPLDADLGKVIAVAIQRGLENAAEVCLVGDPETPNEAALLRFFWSSFAQLNGRVCGYNILGFDLPYLLRRSFALNIEVPLMPRLAKYQTEPVVDLMGILYNWGNARGLKWVCKRYGIQNPLPDLDGSQVANMDRDTLRKYAGNDLALLIELYKRMCGVYLPALESYQPAFLPR
ncbi:MAG TPA: ribonuclease H-like domain-containing protein [Anaerolinea sp.]|nr:ribonuclease H-like domain-containing protein [Anaerolinea sp.]